MIILLSQTLIDSTKIPKKKNKINKKEVRDDIKRKIFKDTIRVDAVVGWELLIREEDINATILNFEDFFVAYFDESNLYTFTIFTYQISDD